MQEDHHQPFLNVNEQMTMACNLKLKPGITMHQLMVFIYSITSKSNCLAITLQIFLFIFFQIFYGLLLYNTGYSSVFKMLFEILSKMK